MSLFPIPEQHAANGPDTWRVEKVRDGLWAIITAQGSAENAGDRLETYPTRKSAVEGLETGWAAQLWEKERRWYAGERIPGWKSWAEVKAEQERTEKRNAERKAAERRKIERQGITPENVTEWREALQQLHIERDSDNPAPDDGFGPYREHPRPEFDNHNPILVWLRAIWSDPQCGTHAQIIDYMLSDVRLIGSEFTEAERAHARRVLTKLAALTTTTNGVTD